MILFKKTNDLRNYLEIQRKEGRRIGFVPTMGALHAGHISLLAASKKDNDITACSIFVNPTQFNDPKDFEKYPITFEKDIYNLELSGCDALFLPSVKEIYPEGDELKMKYDLGYLETILEGKFRPGHFQGVCMVVERLLRIVQPYQLYLGQKDYQQCLVIKKLIEFIKLNTTIRLIVCPTLREPDGLALSSRNIRLNNEERKKAIGIYKSLNFIKKNLTKGNLENLKQQAASILTANGFGTDYVEIADANTLELLKDWDGERKIVALIAAFMNEVRLIDNLLLN